MNEELKIIIKAVTDSAKKEIDEVKKKLDGIKKPAQESGGKVSAAFKGMAKGAAIAVAAVAAVGAALVALGKNSLEFNKEQAKLNAAFQAAGSSAQQASKTYNELYRYLGDSSKATEAAGHLAKITTNQQDLAEWTKITQGIYATFGDSLPIEGLTEAANETIRVGQVTGTMADALNWAGVSEDEFNAKLAQTTSLEEREKLTRETLNSLYSTAAEIYEKNNKALLDYNESQARSQAAMGEAGKAVLPLMTSLNNLSTALFNMLKPALDVIIPPIATFVNWIAKALETTMSFFSALSGSKASIKVVASQTGAAAKGANNLAGGFKDATKQAEAVKRATMGFDELNVVSSGSSSSGGGGGSGSGAGAGSGYIPSGEVTTEFVETESKASGFAEKVKKVFSDIGNTLSTVFAPSIGAWGGAFETVKESFLNSLPDYQEGATTILNEFAKVSTYLLTDFVPTVVNSFSVNIAPVVGDVFGFIAEEGGKAFKDLGEEVSKVNNDIVLPALENMKISATDVFSASGSAWDKHGGNLLTNLSGTLEKLRGHWDNFYATVIQPIAAKLDEVWDKVWDKGLKPLVDEITDAFLDIGNNLLILYNKIIAPVVDWIVKNVFPIIRDTINKVIEIVGNIFISISNTIQGVIQTIKGIIQFITGVFTGDWDKAWEGIKNIFNGIWEAIKGIAKTAWNSIKLVFEPAKTFFSGIWEGIKSVFAKVGTFFSDAFQSAWNGIKKIFARCGTFFQGVWDTIKGIFAKVGSTIGDAISGAIKGAINWILEKAVGLVNGFIDGINWCIKVINKIPGVEISKIERLEVPQFAKGGIVDRATLGVFGEAGKEAVIPLENNTEWMDKLADRIASRNSTPSRIVLMLDGKELGYATIGSINNITRQTGTLPLVLA